MQAAVADRGVEQRRISALGKRDEILEVLRGNLRIDRQHQLVGLDGGDGDDVLARIERHLVEQMRIDSEQVVGADQQAVAIRRGTRDQLADDIAAGAGLVLDHDRLAEPIGQRLRYQPRDDVGGAARRERHVKPNGSCGIVFGDGRQREQRGCDGR